MTSKNLVFASTVHPRKASETNAVLLAESIRAFAGSLSRAPVWCFTPEADEPLSEDFMERTLALDVALIPFKIEDDIRRFPFTGEAHAAAIAECMAKGEHDFVAWLNPNTVVLQEPADFLLPDGKNLGYRPVHHTNIGSRFDEPLDPFWTLVYSLCEVPEDRVFPMETHVDGKTLRPYFNAGFHVTRPGRGLLKAWRDRFLEVYREPRLQEFYEKDRLYAIFVHQAVLSGVFLSALEPDEMLELPPEYNYPLHLHDEDVTDERPTYLEELKAIRHEGFHADPDWRRKMPAGEPLKDWFAGHLLYPSA